MLSASKGKKNENVFIPKREYVRLKQQAKAYRFLAAKISELRLKDPIDEIVEDFRKTDIYAQNFLDDFEKGLRKSSYSKRYAAKAS